MYTVAFKGIGVLFMKYINFHNYEKGSIKNWGSKINPKCFYPLKTTG